MQLTFCILHSLGKLFSMKMKIELTLKFSKLKLSGCVTENYYNYSKNNSIL